MRDGKGGRGELKTKKEKIPDELLCCEGSRRQGCEGDQLGMRKGGMTRPRPD